MCKSKRQPFDHNKKKKERKTQERVNLVQDEYTSDENTTHDKSDFEDDSLFLGVKHEVNSVKQESDWTVKCKVNEETVIMHEDTGRSAS